MNGKRASGPPPPDAAGRWVFVAAVTLLASGLACLFFFTGFREIRYDSYRYFMLSRMISKNGLWNFHYRLSSYAYPLFVSLCTTLLPRSPAATRALVFGPQLLITLATCLYAARVAERVFGSRRFFRGTYLATALNPIALIHATELLTDLLSAVLILLSILPTLERGHPVRRAACAFLAAGLSVAVRPANLVVVPALALVWILRTRLYRETALKTLVFGAAMFALPLLPQLYGNVTGYAAWTPLLADRLYGKQVGWGMSILKYGTLVLPGREPQLYYRNPFYPAGAASPAQFFGQRPAGYLATLAAHGFALLDQDLPFTYITDVKPWYRWPLSLCNYAFLFLALLGVGVGLRRLRERSPPVALYFVATLAIGVSYVAIYLPVAVENRFSLPLYLILAPAVVFAFAWLAETITRHRTATLLTVSLSGAVFLAACVRLSLWLSAQAPALARLAGS